MGGDLSGHEIGMKDLQSIFSMRYGINYHQYSPYWEVNPPDKNYNTLTHWGLVTPYGAGDLGQH